MGSIAASLENNVFCDRCGLKFEPKQPVCTECGAAPTRHWLQLMSLITLWVAVMCNSLVSCFLLPNLIYAHPSRRLFRAWLWLDDKSFLYGWLPVVLGLLLWDHFVWQRSRPKGSKPKIKRWATRKLLSFVLAAATAPLLPWWIPSLQPSDRFLLMIGRYPGLPSAMAWIAVIFVFALLCLNAQTRDSLLGHGRVLSLISLGVLLLVLTMTLVGWSFT
jgi:hypothetical protein